MMFHPVRHMALLVFVCAAFACSGSTPPSDAATSGDGTSQAALPLSCANFCSIMSANCNDTNMEREYVNGSCMAECQDMAAGTLQDDGVDTLGCRQHHAVLAASNTAECRNAAPSGGDTCPTGGHCEAYCRLALTHCAPGVATPAPYPDMATCMTACAAYPYNPAVNETQDTTHNTFNCRVYHLGVSYGPGLRNPHCAHSSPTSDQCVM